MGFWSYLLKKKYSDIQNDSEFEPLHEFDGQTHNTGRLWMKALNGVHLSDFEGVQAKSMLPKLNEAIQWICEKPEEFRHLEADNGWGTTKSALRYLRELRNACEDYPDSFYHWSG